MSTSKSVGIVTLLAIICSVNGNTIISSPIVTNLGVWGSFQRCPSGSLARVVQLKTHAYAGALVDDTSLNGIKFYCGDHWDIQTPQITSTEGGKGTWGNHFPCGGDGYIIGFQLRVEKFNALNDNTATNNAKFFCSNHNNGNYIIGDGEIWGLGRNCFVSRRTWCLRYPNPSATIFLSDTGLNNINLDCCPVD